MNWVASTERYTHLVRARTLVNETIDLKKGRQEGIRVDSTNTAGLQVGSEETTQV